MPPDISRNHKFPNITLQGIRDFVLAGIQLSKVRMWMAIGITILPGMLTAKRPPEAALVFWTILGTIFVAISSFVFNQIWEKEKDRSMARTHERPLPSGRLSDGQAWFFGLALLVSGAGLLYTKAGALAAFWALASFFIYIFVYTCLLKSRTAWNTIVGGFSGAVGPLIGEAAVSGQISLTGFWMFLLLFIWQPPHFWVLALRLRKEYASVGIRMLPVVRGVRATWVQILVWEIALLVFLGLAWKPLALFSFGSYLAPSLGTGLVVLFFMFRLAHKGEAQNTMLVFWSTILHMLVWHLSIALTLVRNF